jgi:hypothetical protein
METQEHPDSGLLASNEGVSEFGGRLLHLVKASLYG